MAIYAAEPCQDGNIAAPGRLLTGIFKEFRRYLKRKFYFSHSIGSGVVLIYE